MRSQEDPNFFFVKKGPVQGQSHCYGARMALYCVPTELLSANLCTLGISRCSMLSGDATELLRRCLRSYCVHLGVLHFSWSLWDGSENAALV